jgi:hypothetical protein
MKVPQESRVPVGPNGLERWSVPNPSLRLEGAPSEIAGCPTGSVLFAHRDDQDPSRPRRARTSNDQHRSSLHAAMTPSCQEVPPPARIAAASRAEQGGRAR